MKLKLFTLLIYVLVVSAEDWQRTCPKKCQCKVSDNKKVVQCHNAGFETIPSQLSSSINVLDMKKNMIKRISANEFMTVNIIHLHRLYLSSNAITSVDKDAFDGLVIVTDLDLSNNMISWLHTETFSGMKKLRKLLLNDNMLKRLEAYQFPVLPNLHHLEMSYNNISYINNFAFTNLDELVSVSLKGNKLSVLDPEVFKNLNQLRFIELIKNDWVCDCHLQHFVDWIQEKKISENQLSCQSPQSLRGRQWKSLDIMNELACPPNIYIPFKVEYIFVGSNATLECGASGHPLPSVEWTLDRRILSNESVRPKNKMMEFEVKEKIIGNVRWLNLTIFHTSTKPEDYESYIFTCLVENPAGLVERNVTLIPKTLPPIIQNDTKIYLVIAIVALIALVFLICLVILVFCWLRKYTKKPTTEKLMERNNILIVNPLEKSPRTYEKVPQKEIELTELSQGSHKNFEEISYPEEKLGRIRSPLTIYEEEEFNCQKLLDVSGSTLVTDLPNHYPDLLDNAFPRSVSPGQSSYHSLIPLTPSGQVGSPEWRYSYVYPNDHSYKPANQLRPGYVTLPRRPRSSSVPSPPAQFGSPNHLESPKKDPLYDTVGPRRTASGSSSTDLRLEMGFPISPLSTSSPNKLLPTLPENCEPRCSSTLPRPVFHNPVHSSAINRRIAENASPLNGILPHSTNTSFAESLPVSESSTLQKKVAPKPPPKPSKRLSVASSVTSEGNRTGTPSLTEEGPDGTEV